MADLEPNPLCGQLAKPPFMCAGCPVYRECHQLCAVFTGDPNHKHSREDQLRAAYNEAVRAWRAENPDGVAPPLRKKKPKKGGE